MGNNVAPNCQSEFAYWTANTSVRVVQLIIYLHSYGLHTYWWYNSSNKFILTWHVLQHNSCPYFETQVEKLQSLMYQLDEWKFLTAPKIKFNIAEDLLLLVDHVFSKVNAAELLMYYYFLDQHRLLQDGCLAVFYLSSTQHSCLLLAWHRRPRNWTVAKMRNLEVPGSAFWNGSFDQSHRDVCRCM